MTVRARGRRDGAGGLRAVPGAASALDELARTAASVTTWRRSTCSASSRSARRGRARAASRSRPSRVRVGSQRRSRARFPAVVVEPRATRDAGRTIPSDRSCTRRRLPRPSFRFSPTHGACPARGGRGGCSCWSPRRSLVPLARRAPRAQAREPQPDPLARALALVRASRARAPARSPARARPARAHPPAPGRRARRPSRRRTSRGRSPSRTPSA